MTMSTEQKNATYCSRIDEIAKQFQKGHSNYAKDWVDKLIKTSSGDSQAFICIWGAGQFGHDIYSRFLRRYGITVSAFCDSDPRKWGTKLWGISVISPQEIKSHYHIAIAVNGHEKEIYRECLKLGVPAENIFYASVFVFSWTANYLSSVDRQFCDQMIHSAKEAMTFFGDDSRSKDIVVEMMQRRLLDASIPAVQDGIQYFIPELPLRADEAFVDAGAFNGDTLAQFINCFPPEIPSKGVHYYAFECGKASYEAFQRNLDIICCDFPVELHPVALWDKEEYVSFFGTGTSGLINEEDGEEKILAVPLDKFLEGKKVSWIKMDIEGAEMRAISGCASIIQTQKPRLTISVYHDILDFYQIPKFIKSLRSDYKMLLRHHSSFENETVLYAY